MPVEKLCDGAWITNVVRSALLIALVAACGPSVDDSANDNNGSGNAADDGSAGDDGNPYDGCASHSFYFAELMCDGGAFGVTVPGTCLACACHDADCDRDSDCPTLSSGAGAECRNDSCVLRCDDDGDCPGEMRCGSLNADESPVCAEIVSEPLACAGLETAEDWPDPCPALADEASCEALTSDLGFACKWATHSLYQVPSDDCLPTEVTQSCIMTARSGAQLIVPGTCETPGLCAATETRVFFEDIGGGTVRLIAYDDCDVFHVPMLDTQGNPVEHCDYSGTTPLPIVCGCACP